MYNDHVILFLFVALLSIFLIIGIDIYHKKQKQYKIAVKRSSVTCKELAILNSQYFFHELQTTYTFKKNVKSKTQFDHFDSFKFLVDIVANDIIWAESLLKKAEENSIQFEDYRSNVKRLPRTPDHIIEDSKVPFSKYSDIEDKYIREILLRPVVRAKICIVVSYTTPKGRNHYRDESNFCDTDLKYAIVQVKEQQEKRSSRDFQRTLMTPKLRYKILQRDGFRCCICGASSYDGTKLEVDHIIPVSKGGRTVDSNLRTLCQACNRGKSDEYDPSGIN